MTLRETRCIASALLCDALAFLFSPPTLARGRGVAAGASPIVIVDPSPGEEAAA
jgi:hypothetical protein